MTRRYSDEEMQEILRRALEAQDSGEGFEHEDLVAAAVEVGIDGDAVEKAALAMREEREALAIVKHKQRKKRRGFFKSLGTFAVINAFLFAIDFLTPGGPWFYWPLLGWGLFVALHGLKVLPPMSADAEQEAVDQERRRLARQREKEARRRRKEAERAARRARGARFESAESAFEAVVEEGVAALLGAVADQISRATSSGDPDRVPSEFDRYVDQKKGKRGRARDRARASAPSSEPIADPPPSSAAQVRVGVDPAVDQAAAEVVEEELEALRKKSAGR